jgi:hypothetical protein
MEIRFLGVRDQLDAQAGDDISPGRGSGFGRGLPHLGDAMLCRRTGPTPTTP